MVFSGWVRVKEGTLATLTSGKLYSIARVREGAYATSQSFADAGAGDRVFSTELTTTKIEISTYSIVDSGVETKYVSNFHENNVVEQWFYIYQSHRNSNSTHYTAISMSGSSVTYTFRILEVLHNSVITGNTLQVLLGNDFDSEGIPFEYQGWELFIGENIYAELIPQNIPFTSRRSNLFYTNLLATPQNPAATLTQPQSSTGSYLVFWGWFKQNQLG